MGIYAKNCPEWLITEIACGAYSLVIVPLYDTLGHDAISYIVNQTGMSAVVCAEDKLANLFAVAKQCKSLQYVIKIGTLSNGIPALYIPHVIRQPTEYCKHTIYM